MSRDIIERGAGRLFGMVEIEHGELRMRLGADPIISDTPHPQKCGAG